MNVKITNAKQAWTMLEPLLEGEGDETAIEILQEMDPSELEQVAKLLRFITTHVDTSAFEKGLQKLRDDHAADL